MLLDSKTPMGGFVDIHTHLLAAIDDGPRDLCGSVEMARAAVASGIAVIAATPHLRSDFPAVHIDEIGARCRQVQDALDAAGIPLRVVSGAECSLVWALQASREELQQASFDGLGRDLLVETPGDASMIEDLLYQLQARGIRVTLAHPERSGDLRADPNRYRSLVEQGVLLQVNAESLLSGRATRRTAELLVRDRLAAVLASDGHAAAPPRAVSVLPKGIASASRLVGKGRAHWMGRDVPLAIVEGREIPQPPQDVTSRRLWSRRRS